MNWVTWKNVGVDRIACAWLIRRQIDPGAVFHFVPEGDPVNPEVGEAFDIPGARYSHRQGHATFHALVDAQGSEDPVLHRISRIVDEADTIQEVTLEPLAVGLDAICRGVRLSSRDDLEAFDRGAVVFEALYALIAAQLAERKSQ